MIKSIEFRESVLSLTITLPGTTSAAKSDGRVEFYFGKGGAISELHRCELVNFLYTVDPESADKIGHLVFELLGTQARICRIDFYRLDSASESLEGGAAPDVGVQLAGGAVECTGGEEEIPF